MSGRMLPSYPEAKRRALARNVLGRTLQLKRGENVLIETWSETLPWAESAVLEARRLGARPLLIVEDEPTYWKSLAEVPIANVGPVGNHEWAALKAADAHFYFLGPMDTAREESRPASLVNRMNSTDHEWFSLVEKYGVRCARWDLGRTSEVWARRYGVDLDRWRSELIDAASVDPSTLRTEGRRVADRLRRGRVARVTHPNGTDLTLHLAGRAPRVDDGVVDAADVRSGNVVTVVPSGVTTVAVKETAGDGVLTANSAGVLFARDVEIPLLEGSWTLKGGRVVGHEFKKGEREFRRAVTAAGSAGVRPGLLSVGLNPGISTIPLLFDQERGTITFEVGRNSHFGGASRVPRLSGYLSVRGGSLEVDGRPVVEAGEIL
jgi:aminopeptidase